MFDGTHIWVSNNGDSTVSKLRASDGVVVGTYSVGSGPGQLMFDGIHIWVYNKQDSTLSKLRASDGVVVGTYSTGTANPGYPSAVGSDGTHIWVASGYDDNFWGPSLTILRMSDGMVEGSYPGPPNTFSRVVFDSTYMWTVNWGEDAVTKSRTVGLC
jgi:hypothetical protein